MASTLKATGILSSIWSSRKFFLFLLTPIVFLPILILNPGKVSECGYVLLIMAVFWIFEVLPLSMTALLPVMMFPFFGILTTQQAATAYMKDAVMFCFSSMIIALAVEHCRLHQRIALRVLLIFGTKPHRLLLGFMVITAFLSMWMSNTVTVTIMVPIVEGVVHELFSGEKQGENTKAISKNSFTMNEHSVALEDNVEAENTKVSTKKYLLLGICFSSSIGGTATLTGTGTNLIFKGIIDANFPHAEGVTFASWMLFNLPVAIINILVMWLFFVIFYFRTCSSKASPYEERKTDILREHYEDLGPISFHESAVLTVFIVVIIMWITKDPEVVPGWQDLIGWKIGDSTPTLAMAALLFIIPSVPSRLSSCQPLVTWKIVEKRLPWGTLLLIGGSLSLADGFKASGLSKWAGDVMSGVGLQSAESISFLLSLMALMLTEVASNVATNSIILPIVAHMAVDMKIHPFIFMIPVTLACSYAFMLPVATPANVLACQFGDISTRDMIVPGTVIKFLNYGVALLCLHTFGSPMFGLSSFPQWANVTFSSNI